MTRSLVPISHFELGMWTHHWHPGEAAKSRAEDVLGVIVLHFDCQVPGTGAEEGSEADD